MPSTPSARPRAHSILQIYDALLAATDDETQAATLPSVQRALEQRTGRVMNRQHVKFLLELLTQCGLATNHGRLEAVNGRPCVFSPRSFDHFNPKGIQ